MFTVGVLSGGYDPQTRAAIALLTWWAVMLVLLLGVGPRVALPRPALAAAACLVGLGLLTALSMSWANDGGRAFTELVRVAGYSGLFVLVLLLSPPGSGRAWLIGLCWGLVALAVIALASRLLPSAFPEPKLIRLVPDIQSRLSYPVGYWNALGALMALALVLLAWLQASAVGRLARSAAAALIPLAALTLLLTSSRGAVVALVFGLAILVALEPRRSRLLLGLLPAVFGTGVLIGLALARDALIDGPVRGDEAITQGHELLALTVLVLLVVGLLRFLIDPVAEHAGGDRRVGRLLVAAGALLLVLALAFGHPGRRVDEFKEPPARYRGAGYVVKHLTSSKGQGRHQLWQAAWRAFKSEPVRGIGAGGYEAWWTRTRTIFHPVRDAHSLYLETLAELGLAGALLLAGLLVAALVAARQAEQRSEAAVALALIAGGGAMAGIDWMWELPAVFGIVVIAAGVLTGAGLRRPVAAPRRGNRALAGAVAVALVGAGVGALGFLGETQLADSRAAARRGELGTAADKARDASAALPWSSAPWLQLALVEERRDLGAAVAAADRAVAKAPEDWRAWLVAGRLRAKAGRVEDAARALEEATRLNPRTPLLR